MHNLNSEEFNSNHLNTFWDGKFLVTALTMRLPIQVTFRTHVTYELRYDQARQLVLSSSVAKVLRHEVEGLDFREAFQHFSHACVDCFLHLPSIFLPARSCERELELGTEF